MIKHIQSTDYANIFVVGDIHGCYNELLLCLQEINFNFSTDLLISVGDIVDRGTNDVACMSLQLEPWFTMVAGNHESLHLSSYLTVPSNGTYWAVPLDLDNNPDYQAFLSRCAELPDVILIDDHICVVHAALPPICYSNLAPDDVKPLLESYNYTHNLYRLDPTKWAIDYVQPHYDPVTHKGITLAIHGHYSLPRPTYKGNTLFLDTGFMSPMFSKSEVNSLSFYHINSTKVITCKVDFLTKSVSVVYDRVTVI